MLWSSCGLLTVHAINTNGPPEPTSSVTLAWDPSPDTNVTGYFLCWGFASGECTNWQDAGNLTSATLSGLQTNVVYYLTVVAYDGAGRESLPAGEIQYVLPGPVPQLKLQPQGGGGLSLRFQGYGGENYAVLASQDLLQWETLWATNCLADGVLAFPILDRTNYPQRYYRVVVTP